MIGILRVGFGEMLVHLGGDAFADDLVNETSHVAGAEDIVAEFIDNLALEILHVVEVEHALAALVVALFEGALGSFNELAER